MYKRKILSIRRIIALLFVMVFFSQTLNAKMHFVSQEELAKQAEYIVVAKMQNSSNTGKTIRWGDTSADVIKNKLKVVESIKGSWVLDKPLFLNTFKFDSWMEDNVELPSKGSKVVLFLKHNDKGELKPVNGIHGVWPMRGKVPARGDTGIDLKEIREMVEKQAKKGRFISDEQLVKNSTYIVLAWIQNIHDTGKRINQRGMNAIILENKLKVTESIKGKWPLEKPLVLYTLKFDEEKRDNVKLPPKGSDVLLFLKKDKYGKLIPVNSIQGVMERVWGESLDKRGRTKSIFSYRPIHTPIGENFSFVGLDSLRKIVRKQHICKSEVFTPLVNRAEIETQAGHYKEALYLYRKAYRICPMKDMEEQMVWLMWEVGDEKAGNCQSKSFIDLQLSAVGAFDKGDMKKSLELFRKASELCPTDEKTKSMVELLKEGN